MFEMRAVWEVLSSREERELSLSTGVMPVFREKPTREWRGHSSDILDLNWSKVSSTLLLLSLSLVSNFERTRGADIGSLRGECRMISY